MSEETEPTVIFRTSHYPEVETLAAQLEEAGIPIEIRLAVPAANEPQAVALLEAHMEAIGAAPHKEMPEKTEEADALLPCPNCEALGLTLGKPCAGCGYKILPAAAPPVSVKTHTPGAQSFCPECRDPLTFSSGKCGACGEEYEPLESGDLLCPALTHVLYRDTVGGFVCKACRLVWVELAA